MIGVRLTKARGAPNVRPDASRNPCATPRAGDRFSRAEAVGAAVCATRKQGGVWRGTRTMAAKLRLGRLSMAGVTLPILYRSARTLRAGRAASSATPPLRLWFSRVQRLGLA
jgi:hypothetical protein